MKTAWKFLRTGLKSNYDQSVWTVGEWRKVSPPQKECVGLNASKNMLDALQYVRGEILARVEYRGEVIDSGDKLTCEEMRIVKAWEWTKEMSVQFAIYAAEQVIEIYEKEYPDDKRPREAIEAARAWLKKPTSKTAYAANAAAYAAADAANAAAYAAYAAYAANAAARNKLKQNIHRWIIKELLKERNQ